jgi:hypothetical protein
MFAGSEPTSFSESSARESGQVALLLLLGAEVEHRHGHADALVRREESPRRRAARSHDRQRADVRQIREPEPAVLPRDLDAEGAELREPVEHLLRDPALSVDGVAIDVGASVTLERRQERRGPELLLGLRLGMRMDEAEVGATLEERLREAPLLPVLLACVLGDFPGFVLCRQLGVARHGSLPGSAEPRQGCKI